jgi:hypothetical protein
MNLLKNIFSSQIEFEGVDNSDKFFRFFLSLYKIEIFKDGLDLVLTRVAQKDLKFEIKIIKDWDTNLGCYLTQQSKVFNQILGVFSSAVKKKIIIKSMTHTVMAHEMAHAIEFESGINLGEQFRKCIALDMKGREASFLSLKSEIKKLMVDALKAYKPHQILSELFARYFELLSKSRDVSGSGDFSSLDAMNFFANTTNFITKIFNPKIKLQVDKNISEKVFLLFEQQKQGLDKKKFGDKVDSFFKTTNQKKFSQNIKSNSRWTNSWNQKQIFDK